MISSAERGALELTAMRWDLLWQILHYATWDTALLSLNIEHGHG
jgi:hypothetical protein